MWRFLSIAGLCGALAACGGEAFSTATGNSSIDGGSGGAGDGGRAAGGSSNGKGGANAGKGGTAGNGGASAGGTMSNGGANAGGAMSNGGAGAGGTIGVSGAGGTMSSGGTSAGGTMSSGGVVGSGGSIGSGQSGDCTIGLDNCHNGTTCVEVTPGGYRVCATRFDEANACDGMGGCCKSSDCQNGQLCFPGPLFPYCGGPSILPGNICSGDICTSDSACGSTSICAPAGTFMNKVRMCIPATCRRDVDCNDSPGGICAPVYGGCCSSPYGLACVYPGTGCRSNADCQSQNCEIDQTGKSYCDPNPFICPV